MTPIQTSIELLAQRMEENNLLIKGLLGHRQVQMDFFNGEIIKNLLIIATIFVAIMVAAFTIPEAVGYFAIGGFVASVVPIVIIGKAVRGIFN